MDTINEDIASYEQWLRSRCEVVESDLDAKHERMRESAFKFLRATYFRWATTVETICPQIGDAPKTLCVGDLHVENFGTWRDALARPVWGVNDFDEAASMPYTFDLVRLATSARLAPALEATPTEAEAAILEGYAKGLEQTRPTLLDEYDPWLSRFIATTSTPTRRFWHEIEDCVEAQPPRPVRKALQRELPEGACVKRFARRRKGGGSLGRPRFVVVAQWQGGQVVWEAKAMVPSAWHWAHARPSKANRFLDVALGAYRSPDPSLTMRAGYALRRLAPDVRKVEFDGSKRRGLSARMLMAMAADLAAIHAATKHRRSHIVEDLRSREPRWLHGAAVAAEQAVRRDFDAFGRS
jgi:hypothetical protein